MAASHYLSFGQESCVISVKKLGQRIPFLKTSVFDQLIKHQSQARGGGDFQAFPMGSSTIEFLSLHLTEQRGRYQSRRVPGILSLHLAVLPEREISVRVRKERGPPA